MGEDPLALLAGTNSPGEEEGEGSGVLSHHHEEEDGDSFTRHQAVVGPVRLELGMDAEVLDKILGEIEVNFTHSFFLFFLGSPSAFYHRPALH